MQINQLCYAQIDKLPLINYYSMNQLIIPELIKNLFHYIYYTVILIALCLHVNVVQIYVHVDTILRHVITLHGLVDDTRYMCMCMNVHVYMRL